MNTRRAYRTVDPLFVQQIVDMYSSGKNQKEIVETTGQTYYVVRYWLKKKGLYDSERRQSGSSRKRPNLEKIALKLMSEGFAYLGGYENSKSNIDVSCLVCGKVFKRNAHEIPKHITVCPFCKQEEALQKRLQKRTQKQAKYEQYLKEQQEYWEAYRQKKQEEKQQEKDCFLDEKHICKECGCKFTFREYAEQEGFDPIFANNIEYCSRKCKHKAFLKRHEKGDHIKRAKKHGCEWERGITLNRLIQRDGLRCALCGGMCDLNDKSYGNGSGPNYPSIDHIKPISKGGSHTWENVQVAHIICNTRKRDEIV